MSARSTAVPIEKRRSPLWHFPFDRLDEQGFRMRLVTDPPGIAKYPGGPNTVVSVHVGPSSYIRCRRGDDSHCGTAVHGDIDIMPAGMPSIWELREADMALVLGLSPGLLDSVAEQLDVDPRRVEIRNRFQIRDPQLENISWALKAQAESDQPCERLYLDSLAVSVAVRLITCYSSAAERAAAPSGRIPDRRLRQVLAYVEDNIARDISLAELAAVAGLSVSHFKSLFRASVGVPVHQYLIRRRVERAKTLLAERKLSIAEVALEAGFAHQSHLARHMRRLLGVSPKALRDTLR
jgi:AraC family transcriptional regulator